MDHAHQEFMDRLLEDRARVRELLRGFAQTLRDWAVAAGGHTPSAIVAGKLLELIGEQP